MVLKLLINKFANNLIHNKMKKVVFLLALIGLVFVGCKNETKKQDKKTEAIAENIQKSSFKISGMTCNIGCAKKIQSDLSKKEGVINAEVVFSDSTAIVKYDGTKIDKAGLATFIEGVADGKTYEVTKISDITTTGKAKQCNPNCTKQCGSTKSSTAKACCKDRKKECSTAKVAADGKKPCGPSCKGQCESKTTTTVKACCKDRKKECSTTKKVGADGKKPCGPNCKGKCGSKKSTTAKACSKNCKKECCASKSEAKSCKPGCDKACCA